MKKILSLALLAVIALAACNKYEDLPAPAIDPGNCQYNKAGLSESVANAELSRIVGIFQNATIGSFAVEVKSSKVYPSETKNGSPISWGVQVVFSCDGAKLKFEEVRNFSSSQDASRALNARLAILNAGRFIKVLDKTTNDYSTTDCDTCCDEDGYNCGDCNCTTDYDYAYSINYAEVDPNNNRQAGMIQAYEQMSQKVSAATGNPHVSVSDTLSAAKRVLPAFTTEGKVVRQWQQLITEMGKMPRQARKACPKTSRVVQPNSSHRYYP